MSRQNVEHYMRFRDQMKMGADGKKAASSRQQAGLDRERQPGYISAGNHRVLQNSWPGLQNFRKKLCNIRGFDGEWCNGSTTDSDSVCLGSNPGSPATPNFPISSVTSTIIANFRGLR
jgi:hypothetical protein